jgi:beta-lactamase class A
MSKRALFLALLSFVLFTSCVHRITDEYENPADVSSGAVNPPIPVENKPDVLLQQQIQEVVANANAHVGVGAVLLETGDSVFIDPDGHFPSQSVYKLPIAMTVLKRVDANQLHIDQEIVVDKSDFVRWGFHSPIRNLNPQGTVLPLGELIRASISESDGTASDVLLELAGGPTAVQSYLSEIGIKDFIVADSEKEISKDWETQYRNWATPRASIALLREVEFGKSLSEPTRRLLLECLTDSNTGRRRIRAGLPSGTPFAHKTGTGGTKDGVTGATNDIGIITTPDGKHIAIAVYIADSTDDGWTREQLMADIAKIVWYRWVGGETDPYTQIREKNRLRADQKKEKSS